MSTRVLAATTLKTLSFDRAVALVEEGAAFVDLRPIAAYLEVHVPGSVALVYEAGPGMAGRARDCIPLSQELILLTDETAHMGNAAAALRGKGFPVLGQVEDAISAWSTARGSPASTEIVEGPQPPEGALLHVGDPGVAPQEGALHIPVERLWERVGEVPEGTVVVLSGYGVRAGLAIGILERAGRDVRLWQRDRRP
jgi:hydroxyacylglutathione hydrolase